MCIYIYIYIYIYIHVYMYIQIKKHTYMVPLSAPQSQSEYQHARSTSASLSPASPLSFSSVWEKGGEGVASRHTGCDSKFDACRSFNSCCSKQNTIEKVTRALLPVSEGLDMTNLICERGFFKVYITIEALCCPCDTTAKDESSS